MKYLLVLALSFSVAALVDAQWLEPSDTRDTPTP